jgi:hypothetical protein
MVKKLSKSCQKVVKKLSKYLFDFRKGIEEYEGFPRPGGDFVAPGNKLYMKLYHEICPASFIQAQM